MPHLPSIFGRLQSARLWANIFASLPPNNLRKFPLKQTLEECIYSAIRYYMMDKPCSTPPFLIIGCRIVFGCFFASGFVFFWFSFPVPFALYLQQFGTRTCHFAWYLLHFGMVTLHFAWYLLHLAMSTFHFAWYLSHFFISTSHLHGICYILVLQTFMWVSWGFFRLSFRVSFKVSFRVSFSFYLGLYLGFHLGFHLGFL